MLWFSFIGNFWLIFATWYGSSQRSSDSTLSFLWHLCTDFNNPIIIKVLRPLRPQIFKKNRKLINHQIHLNFEKKKFRWMLTINVEYVSLPSPPPPEPGEPPLAFSPVAALPCGQTQVWENRLLCPSLYRSRVCHLPQTS